MRAATLVRACLVVMFLASLGVAGTTVVMRTAQTFLAQVDLETLNPPALDADEQAPPIERHIQSDQLERQLRSYQVRLTPAGDIEGRINVVNPLSGGVNSAQDMSIYFLQEGQVIAETRPGLEGRFAVALQPGVYAVVGSGADGYVAFAMQVLPAELTVDIRKGDIQQVAYQEVASELAIDSVAVPVTDLPVFISLVESNVPPELLQPEPSGEGMTTGPAVSDEYDVETTTNRSDVALQGHQVQIRPDGRLEGRVHRINQNGEPTRIRRVNVFLVQNNQVVAQAPVDELGSFSFFDVEDGVYSFVAAGVEGLAAFTMQAVSGPDLAGVADQLLLPVAFTNAAAGPGATGMVGGANAGTAFGFAQGGGGGPGGGGYGSNGGSGGGAGGGGGGSGFGLLGALLPLAAVPFLLDDNNSGFIPVLVSPVTP